MSSINTLRKVATAAVVGAAFFASSANAFTLVNHAAPVLVSTGTRVGIDPATPPTYLPTPASFTVDYAYGGIVKFVLDDTVPDFETVNFRLFSGADLVSAWSLTEVADGLAKPFYTLALAGGSYTLKLDTVARGADILVSAVPVPGAALLFGTTVLGFLGLNKRRKS